MKKLLLLDVLLLISAMVFAQGGPITTASSQIRNNNGLIRRTSYRDSLVSKPDNSRKITSAAFSGHWHGDENCSQLSTPDAVLNIKANGADEVVIMGLYASNGGIKGTVIGNTVSIPSQVVPDFGFNISIEGVLVISSDHQFLNSHIIVTNNGLKDICANSYTR